MNEIDLTWALAGRALLGGALIGLAAALLLAANGRIAGVSGVLGQMWTTSPADRPWRAAFVGGLLLGGLALSFVAPSSFGPPVETSTARLVIAGLLVGVGTQLANGCTSGHGICGLSRGSIRSLAATTAFMIAGALVVAIVRGRFGGS